MKCNLKNRSELIADYLAGQLPEEQAKAFEEHYFQCEICFRELRIAEDALNMIEKEGAEAFTAPESSRGNIVQFFSSKISKSNFSRKQSWGATIAAVTAAAVIFVIIITSHPDKPGSPVLSGPAFQPDPYREEWITESTRSGGERLDAVFSPEIGAKFQNEEVVFQWKMREEIPLTLRILTNTEDEILSFTPDSSHFPMYRAEVSQDIFPASGLYYWLLEDDDEVLYVGKFYFIKD